MYIVIGLGRARRSTKVQPFCSIFPLKKGKKGKIIQPILGKSEIEISKIGESSVNEEDRDRLSNLAILNKKKGKSKTKTEKIKTNGRPFSQFDICTTKGTLLSSRYSKGS